MELTIDRAGETATLRLNGDFTMESQLLFRETYRQLFDEHSPKILALDLARTEYLDSSALGMLVVLRNEAEQAGITVRLTNCRPFIIKLLRGANFDRLFRIS